MNVGASLKRDKVSFRSESCSRFVLIAAILLTPLTTFPDYQTGLEAYQSGDFDLAITEWQQVVESPPGTVPPAIRAETLYAIGMLFWLGQGVQQDSTESASWLKPAAEMHHPGAQTKLAYLYSTGQGVQQSNFEALKWWQMAANQGDTDAQYNLGVLYRDGQGVEPDPEESLKWFREAAANGDPVSAKVIEDYEFNGELTTNDSIHTSTVPDVQKPDDSGTTHEDWIRQRNPNHYTIQVVALSQPDKLKNYIQQHEEWLPFAIYGQARYEQPLWVLVQGDYPDVEAARSAARKFPQDMQVRENLWIRRFQMVQGLLE